MTTTDIRTGWHFLAATYRLGCGDGRKVRKGRWMHMRGGATSPAPCTRGIPVHERAINALYYAPGPIVCRVEVRGDVVSNDDQFAGRERRVLAWADATWLLHRFTIWCAARALRHASVTDARSWNALRVKSRWICGRATDDELVAALQATNDASGEAELVAWAVARRTVETDAAWGAACCAQVRTEGEVASDAWDAAWGAAWCAARAAQARPRGAAAFGDAWDAAWDEQNVYLERRIAKLLEVAL